MGKKLNNRKQESEEEEDVDFAEEESFEFDGEFEDNDSDGNESDAPVAISKKDAQAKFEKGPKKQLPTQKKQKTIKKEKSKNDNVIRGADIFAQELPSEVVQNIMQKQDVKTKQKEQEQFVEQVKHKVDKLNKKAEKQQLKNPKHIIFQNKKTGKQYMISNQKTMERIEPADQKTISFLQHHMNRLRRVPLSSII
eukprot:403370509